MLTIVVDSYDVKRILVQYIFGQVAHGIRIIDLVEKKLSRATRIAYNGLTS